MPYTVCLISRPLIRLDNILPPTWLPYLMEAETIGTLIIPMGKEKRKGGHKDKSLSTAKPAGLDSLLKTMVIKAGKSYNKLAPKIWGRLSNDCKAQISAAAKGAAECSIIKQFRKF